MADNNPISDPDLTPEVAAKVLTANLRNAVNRVAGGGSLTKADKELMQQLASREESAAPQDLRSARADALLKRWANGARLTQEEQAEIQHLLPSPAAVTPDTPLQPTPLTLSSDPEPPPVQDHSHASTLTAEQLAKRIGLSRRPYFQWLKHGQDHNDPLPAHNPVEVPDWYKRMQARGVFKNTCPAKVRAACSPSAVASISAPIASGSPPGVSANSPHDVVHRVPQAVGIGAEIRSMETRVASLREASDAAYLSGNELRGSQLREQYEESLEKLRKLKKDSAKLLADDDEVTRRAWVEEDLASVIPPMLTAWRMEGNQAFREMGSTLSRADFLRLWGKVMVRVCRKLAASRFATPFELDADAA